MDDVGFRYQLRPSNSEMDLLPSHKSIGVPSVHDNHTMASLQNVFIGNSISSVTKPADEVIGDCSSVSSSMTVLPPVTSFISSTLPSLFPLSGLNDFLVGVTNLSNFPDFSSSQTDTSQASPNYTPTTSNQQQTQHSSPFIQGNNLFAPVNDFNNITHLDHAMNTAKGCLSNANDCISSFVGESIQSKTPLPSLNTLLKAPYDPHGLAQVESFQHPNVVVSSPVSNSVSSPQVNGGIKTSEIHIARANSNQENYGMTFPNNSINNDVMHQTSHLAATNDFANIIPSFSQESHLNLNCSVDTSHSYQSQVISLPSIASLCSSEVSNSLEMPICSNATEMTLSACITNRDVQFTNLHNLHNIDPTGTSSVRPVSTSNENSCFPSHSLNQPSALPTPSPAPPVSLSPDPINQNSLQSFTSAFCNGTKPVPHIPVNFSDLNMCVEETRCFKCKFCNFISLQKLVVISHVSTVHKEKVHREFGRPPGHLGKSNVNSPSLVIDIEVKTSSSDPSSKQFICSKCSQSFQSLPQCRQHILIDHLVNARQIRLKNMDDDSENCNGKVQNSGEIGHNVLNKYVSIKQKPTANGQQSFSPTESAPNDADNPDPSDSTKKKLSKHSPKNKKCLSQSQKAWRKKIKREQGSYICEFKGCNIRFRILDNLEFHRKCHVSGSTSFACTECNKHCEQWCSMAEHLWRNHKLDMELHACDQCSFRTYSLSKLENVHKVIHSNERPFLCDTCGVGFKSNKQLLNHKAARHSKNPKRTAAQVVICDICNRKFNDQRILRIHMESVHKKVRPYLCNYCGYSASNQSTLRGHLRQHTGEKPFACDICEYRTKDHNSLRRHKMRHSGEKPYKCHLCPYACIQACTFKSHLKKQHPGNDGGLLFSCNICSFWSLKKDNYMTHMAEHKVKAMQQEMLRPIMSSDTMTPTTDYNMGQPEQMTNPIVEDRQTLGLVEAMGLHLAHSSQDDLGDLSTTKIIFSNLDVLEQANIT